MDLIKKYWWIFFILALILFIILIIAGGNEAIKYFTGNVTNPPPPSEVGIPEDATPVPIIGDRYTIVERANPFHAETRAEELTKDLPSGTEVYEVIGEGLIYRTPDGFIYETGELDVIAYKTPAPFIAAEFRPKVIATTDFSTAGVGIELDLLRIGRLNVGPSVGGNFNKTVWFGAGAGINVWKNVDVGGYGGYGTDGVTYGVSVGIAIE